MKNFAKFLLASCATAGLAGCAADAEPTLDLDRVDLSQGKADDAADVGVYRYGGGFLVEMRGEVAMDLWGVMEDAGGFEPVKYQGLDYLVGQGALCATNDSAAVCQVVTNEAETRNANYVATIHGQRFASSASELFGALARAQGVSPSQVTFASSDRLECGKDATDVWCGIIPEENDAATLELDVSGLPELGADYVYEGWLITADGPVTSGRFDKDGGIHRFEIDRDLADATTMFVLTIEPRVGDDPAPADVHIVAGPFQGSVADLTSTHGAALGTDFGDSEGAFILETPTTSMVASDYGQGIWFVNPATGTPSLDLPTLPKGWAYEGWVVGQDGPISTGRFASTSGADSDGAGPAAGPDGFPPFPGQDFVSPAFDVVGSTVVISVEPDPDDSPAPFILKPMVLMGADDVGPGVPQSLPTMAAELVGVASWR